MIKYSELMIGDWVLVDGTPRKVEAITKKKIGYHRKENEPSLYYAMQLLRKLQDEKVNLLPCMGKDSRIYSDALYKTLSDLKGMQDFLEGKELRFKDHQTDKKGKLSSCVAYCSLCPSPSATMVGGLAFP